MKRRALLAAFGTGVCGVAGCVGAPDDPADGTTDDGGWTTRPETTETETETRTPEPDPENVTLVASPETATLPKGTIEITLHNGANTTFAFNPYAYSITKRSGDDWVDVAPRAVPEPLALLPPGEENAWSIHVDNATPSSGWWDNSYGEDSVLLRGLGPGTYRFGISGWFEGGGTSGPRRGYSTTLELTGDPIELEPDPSVTTTRRDGTVSVETTDGNADVDIIVKRSDYDGVVATIITEEAYRYAGLRNTLPFFEDGVERVGLSAVDSLTLVPDGLPYLEYDGTTYRVQVEYLE